MAIMTLLERDHQLASLHQALDTAATGAGCTALITGEAGIGKTALANHFSRCVGERARVVWGTCEALFTPRPLGAFYDIAHALGGTLAGRLQDGAKPVDLFHALLSMIDEHAQPTVIVLEDLHWADHATLDFVRFLARRIARLPLLLICTYRDDEVTAAHPLNETFGDIPAAARTLIRLPTWSRDTVEQLALEAGSRDTDVYRITGGNPFFVTEVIAARSGDLAPTIRQAVLARAARLSSDARAALDLVSVVPDHLELTLLEGPLQVGLSELEECTERGLLTLGQGHVSFRHELARMAIESALSAVKRARLNRKVLEALCTIADATSNANVLTRLAHHAIAAQDGPAILRFTPLAARVAGERGAQHEATRLLTSALPFVEQLPLPERAAFLERCARSTFIVGASIDALALYERAFSLWSQLGNETAKAKNLLDRCEIIFAGDIHRRREIDAMADAAVELLAKDQPSPALALATLWQGVALARSDPTSARARLGEGLAIGEATAAPPAMVEILHRAWHLEMVLMTRPSPERGSRLVDLARKHRLDHGVMLGYLHAFVRAFREFDLPEMERMVEEGLRFASDRQLERFYATRIQQRHRVEIDQHRGRWQAADRQVQAFEAGEEAYWWVRSVILRLRMAPMYLRWGRPEGAHWLAEMRALESDLLPHELFSLYRALVEQHWLADEIGAGREVASRLLCVASRSDHPWVLGEAAFWRWVVGEDDQCPMGIPEPYALQLTGRWREASAAWSRMGLPYESGLALVFGDVAAQREALGVFESLHAQAAVELVRRRLRMQGVKAIPQGPRPATRANAAQLTAREMEVLVLLAEGRSNAEIARRLHRSVRTIENHVAALTGKLDADNRLGAVAAARERGILRN